jgi:hypothetical protein
VTITRAVINEGKPNERRGWLAREGAYQAFASTAEAARLLLLERLILDQKVTCGRTASEG